MPPHVLPPSPIKLIPTSDDKTLVNVAYVVSIGGRGTSGVCTVTLTDGRHFSVKNEEIDALIRPEGSRYLPSSFRM